jgi:hypothetical protein
MDQLSTFSDERLSAFCTYCGRPPTTRDHVPPKVFLDEPYPENLPVVSACLECNADLSLNEEYVACSLECAICGSTSTNCLRRDKVRKILQRNPRLAARIESARAGSKDGVSLWKVEESRLDDVIMKLARGHAVYELAELRIGADYSIFVSPLDTMSKRERLLFETPLPQEIYPEIGSRGFRRTIETPDSGGYAHWQIVQAGRYRYLAAASSNPIVRFCAE